ncbi:hypothetical protein CDO26_10720 [Sinorhizobium meliloti]|uniref:helix-turn-helix domain-containing protein n=1 Tax=Rhizobium meliloti TaxID=382 RepID=UPI000B49A978|nr:helix-turn-helix domain-containing protein [Sinorhizobium meliloti]ASP85022.1 hypothetical protein CDO26_10720 [Sinorhizobium meliloti]MQW28477.1 chromosomal replication initiator DnaA [Sinorhizobium meliloti]
MNLHITQEARKQRDEHRAVRDRILNPKVTVKRADVERERNEVAALKAKVEELTGALRGREAKIRHLELDIADRDARIISLADQVSKLDQSGLTPPPKRPVTLIVADVLKDFPGVTWDDIIGVRRTRDLVKPRQLCMVAVYEERKDLSLPMIGKIFRRDHTTILHSVDKFNARRNEGQS